MTVDNPIRAVFARAEREPDAPALYAGRVSMTNRIFADSVRRFAAAIRRDGIRPSDVVGVRAAPAIQAIVIAALMHEAAVSFAARSTILERHASAIDAVYTDDPALAASTSSARLIDARWMETLARADFRGEPIDFVDESSLAHIVFSSGTTGVPKGVPFTIADLRARSAAAHANWMPALPFFCELGLDTVSGMQTLFWSLFEGAEYLAPATPSDDAHTIESKRVASIKTSPAKLEQLVDAVARDRRDVSSVTVVEVAGSLLGAGFAARFGTVFDARLVYLYGSTEVGTVARAEYDATRPNAVGRVVDGAKLQIVDDTGNPVASGSSGAIRITTPHMATRYWRDTDSRSSGFHDGWFEPGDTGHFDDDVLVIDGRADELVNASGVKVDPAWIDTQVGSYRGVADYASFKVVRDDGSSTLALAFVSAAPISVDNFVAHLRNRLGEMTPTVIMRVDAIPRNALGKVLRLELSAQASPSMRKGRHHDS